MKTEAKFTTVSLRICTGGISQNRGTYIVRLRSVFGDANTLQR